MPIDSPKYDVAISFLMRDEPTAAALYRDLSQALNVFFFPRKQEDLAGPDGMESMRKPFLEDSRVMVVLYREQWGKTRWTAIEEAAIKEACFNGEWKRLFFVALDHISELPKWLPEYHVRYNWDDFGVDQAVGAIKARVLENGGQPSVLTPLKRAELLEADNQYRMDRSAMNTQQGMAKILESLKEIFNEIERQCDIVNAQGHVQIRYETDFTERNAFRSCILTDGRAGMIVIWQQQYTNLLDNSGLYVREYNGGLIFNSELGRRMHLVPPDQIAETAYAPELSRAREYGWKQDGKSTEFISSSAFATKCVLQFIDLVERFASGQVTRRHWR